MVTAPSAAALRPARSSSACPRAGRPLPLAAAFALPGPAVPDDTPLPGRVTLMGTLMSELGCPADWDEGCTATDLQREGTVFSLTGTLPSGQYVWKVRMDGSWQENYGAGGSRGGADIALTLQGPAELRFTYDHAAHDLQVRTTSPAPAGVTREDAARAGTSLREDLTRERFSFVMADRFANGDPGNDTGGFGGDKFVHGLDPTHKGFFHGGGTSVALTIEPGEPEVLRLDPRDARGARRLAASGALAVVVYDAAGRIVDATGVEVGSWACPGKP